MPDTLYCDKRLSFGAEYSQGGAHFAFERIRHTMYRKKWNLEERKLYDRFCSHGSQTPQGTRADKGTLWKTPFKGALNLVQQMFA